MTELEQEIERKIEAITRKIEIEQSLHSTLRTALEEYLEEEDTRHENHLAKLEKEKKEIEKIPTSARLGKGYAEYAQENTFVETYKMLDKAIVLALGQNRKLNG